MLLARGDEQHTIHFARIANCLRRRVEPFRRSYCCNSLDLVNHTSLRSRPLMTQHLVALAISLPLQLALIPLNGRKLWFTPGELRFWAIAVFIIVEIAILAIA